MTLSQIHAGRPPFLADSKDKVSCASLLNAIRKALTHLKSVAYTFAHFFPFWTLYWQTSCLKTKDVPGDDNKDFCHPFWIISKTKEWSIVLIPLWGVACIVFLDFLGVIHHQLANSIGSIASFLTMPISAMLIWIWADNAVTRLSLCITLAAS